MLQVPETGDSSRMGAARGNYEGKVTVKTEKGNELLSLHLTVYPLALPDARHLMVTEWCTTSKFKKFHGIDFVGIVFPVSGNQISYQ